jgi:hypothetical protein
MLKTVISLIIGAIIWALLLFAYDVYSGNIRQRTFGGTSFSWQMMPPWEFWSGAIMASWTMIWERWRMWNMTEDEQIDMISKRIWVSQDRIKKELDSWKTMREIIQAYRQESSNSSGATFR